MSIRAKFLVATTGLVVFLGFVIVLLVSTYLYNSLVMEVQERGVAIGNSLADSCVGPILSGDYYRLATLLADHKEAQANIDYAFVIDVNGKVLADTFGGIFPVDLLNINPLNSTDKYRITSFEESGRVYYDIAITILQPAIGTVHLGIPEAPIRKDVLNIIYPMIAIIIIALILSTLAAFIFSRYITRPISILANSVDAIRNGNFNNMEIPSTKDEVGKLAIAFNEMVEELDVTLTKLKDSEKMFRLMNQSANEAVIMLDHNKLVTVWNEAATNLFGFTPEEAIGQDAHSIITPYQPSKEQATKFAQYASPGTHKFSGEKLELRILTKKNEQILIEISLSSVQMKGKWNTICIIRDITQQKELEEHLTRLSYLDGLTNICNRRSFNEHINNECRRAQREQFPISMFMIDIDFFKDYNDTYGHNAGDKCLIKVAQTLHDSLKRPGDYLARYGGEEFAIVAPYTDETGAKQLAKNICRNIEALELPHASSKVSDKLTCSIGIATNILDKNIRYPADLMVSQADEAMYRAKKTGRNRICIY